MVMVERKVQSWVHREPITIQRQWRSWDNLSNNAKLAVIAAEDQRFPIHRGFDVVELRRAWEASRDGSRLRGASTLSQQTAKNVFLWSGRSWLRKGLEAWFTLLIETFWSKQRILEVYLNVAEWDTGVFGLEAAADHYFGASGSALTERQASLLAAILPSPRTRSASRPDARSSAAASGFANRCVIWAARLTSNGFERSSVVLLVSHAGQHAYLWPGEVIPLLYRNAQGQQAA